ncbi:MAG: SGNH/GDSL hydrolase family protein, partial [Thermodesulfobacteriota bacterium]
MKKEWLVLTGTVIVTIMLAIVLLRFFAPQLLGIPIDLQMVQVHKEIVPFYENIFRKEDYQSKEFMLQDPYTNIRAKPLFNNLFGIEGPTDILGFRNRFVPNIADIVVLGDSQTYGVNAVLEENWPSQLVHYLKKKDPTLYNMSTGGWGAVQYLDMFAKALLFQPRVVIVAFYTGNDPLESILMAYNIEHWHSLITDPNVDISEISIPQFSGSDTWNVLFKDGIKTSFTPQLRLASNQNTQIVSAGYATMLKAAQQISTLATKENIHIIFTIIPTKELVYAEKIVRDEISPPEDYRTLIFMEKHNIQELAAKLVHLPNSTYVDLTAPLQQAALRSVQLYPTNLNGHPLPAGYSEIAYVLASIVGQYLPEEPKG